MDFESAASAMSRRYPGGLKERTDRRAAERALYGTSSIPLGREGICRYTDYSAGARMCTAEAADPDAELLLCTRHLALALRLLTHRGVVI